MAEGLSSSASADLEFITDVLATLEANLGVPLRDIVLSDDSVPTIRRRYHEAIRTACLQMAEREHVGDPVMLAAARATIDGLTGAENVVPTIVLTQNNIDTVRTYTGQDLAEYVRSVTNALKLIQEGDSPEDVATQIVGTGLAGFGGAVAYGTIKALIAKQVLKQALMAGIKTAGGVAAVVGIAAVIILELAFYLTHGNKKNFVGMIFNNTDLNLVVTDWRKGMDGADEGDLYLRWGSGTGFMEVHQDGDLNKPAYQVPARTPGLGADVGTLIQAGIYSASKNLGFRGAEGVFVMHPHGGDFPRFAVLFACPYTSDNAGNVAIEDLAFGAKAFWARLDDSRGIDTYVSKLGYSLRARIADPRGGEAFGVAVLDQG